MKREPEASSRRQGGWNTMVFWATAAFGATFAVSVMAVDYPIEIHRGNGLANVFAKLNSGHSVKIAYIGGSVTEMTGYRNNVTSWFNSKYPGRITEINAGWSGTGSLIGAMRYARDVLAQNPDLVFIEFAVNDLPEDPVSFIERNSEGMVRQSWTQNSMADVCFIETIAYYNEPAYLAGYYPNSVQAHYNVCDHYGVSSVNVGWALYEHVLAGTPWESLTIDGDRVHPNASGSQIYSNAIVSYLESERVRGAAAAAHNLPSPRTDYPVTSSTITDWVTVSPLPSGWTAHYNEFGVPSFIQSSTAGSQVSIGFTGPSAAVKIVVSGDSGPRLYYSVDGGAFATAYLAVNGYTYLWALPVAKNLSTGSHTLTIRVDTGVVRLINVESAQTGGGGPLPGDVNLALTAVADATDSVYGPDWTGAKARDGLLNTKWTSTGTTPNHWLALDLGAIADVSCVVVKHAGAGGEPSYYNTQVFTIESGSSMAGPWTTQFTGSNPYQLHTTLFTFAEPQQIRYVRLNISDAGVDNYARIPEFEVWGTIPPAKGDMDLDNDVDQHDFGLFQACYTGAGNPQNLSQCAPARLDDDNDVDSEDFAIFRACLTGPGVPADRDCGR
ncbi:MAG TPA: discoidin domain-containing protein [Phycisphaerae bacterium]|nr:discoidin domain-containing protein [Phycisphaerae bacterium]HRR87377.1 discoidin domain-containing protein [Phycisphaerae bacterium]